VSVWSRYVLIMVLAMCDSPSSTNCTALHLISLCSRRPVNLASVVGLPASGGGSVVSGCASNKALGQLIFADGKYLKVRLRGDSSGVSSLLEREFHEDS
jgi:hypothetical protein